MHSTCANSGSDALQTSYGLSALGKKFRTKNTNGLNLETSPVREDMVQLLTPAGEVTKNAQFSPYVDALTKDDLKRFYRQMVVARRMDLEANRLQRQGKLALWVPLSGQEAAQVGSGNAAAAEDYIFPSYREHAVGLARGVDMRQLFKIFTGISHSGWVPGEKNFHNYTMVLAAQTLHAVGYAMGIQRDHIMGHKGAGPLGPTPEAVMVYLGDGATSEGDAHESMVFASSQQSPIVFFVQNNQWAISVPVEIQSRFPLAGRAQGYGFPGVQVDGNDVLASYAVTRWALERAHNNQGPALIEAYTFRADAHTTADDPTKYRSAEEERYWQEKDPITRFKKYLAQTLEDADVFFDKADQEAEEYVASISDYVSGLKAPQAASMFDNVYGQAHALNVYERIWFENYEAGFAD